MQKLFNDILVPVFLNKKPGSAIEKAIQFANQLQCNLHLVGLSPLSSFAFVQKGIFQVVGEDRDDAEKKRIMSDLQANYCQKMEENLLLSIYYERGEPEKIVSAYTTMHPIDLVFVTDEGRGFSFSGKGINASRLARRINCPVLTLKSNPSLNGLKIIVMPVGKSLPINKIRVAAYLAKRYNASIHLITREKNALMYEELAYMQKALQVLKDNTNLPVKCKTLSGESIGDITMQYAHEVKAGLIVVNPGAESFLPGLFNRLLSRFVSSESTIPVMTVQ